MIRRLPVIPTIVVAAAVAVMIGLGVWQLQRAGWKERLLARYARAETMPPIAWPTVPLKADERPLFRHATGVCFRPIGRRAVAGENQAGESGYAHIIDCATGAEGPGMSVEVGWSRNPNAPVNWAGGPVSGIIVPDRRSPSAKDGAVFLPFEGDGQLSVILSKAFLLANDTNITDPTILSQIHVRR